MMPSCFPVLWRDTERSHDRSDPSYCCTAQHTPMRCHVVAYGPVQQATVVPHHQITPLPTVAMTELWLRYVLGQLGMQSLPLLQSHAANFITRVGRNKEDAHVSLDVSPVAPCVALQSTPVVIQDTADGQIRSNAPCAAVQGVP